MKRSRLPLGLLSLLTLLSMLAACGKKAPPEAKAGSGTGSARAASKAAPAPLPPLPTTVEGWLGLVPADAKVAAAVLDARKLLGVVSSLEDALKRLPFGGGLVAQAHAAAARAPVPVPWTAADLRKLGIDEQKPMLLVVRERMPLAYFGISDEAAFKKNLAALATRGAGSWKESSHDGVTLAALVGGPPLHCALAAGFGRCSPDPELVVQSLRKPPERSLWSALSADEQRLARSAHALLHRGDQGGMIIGRVEADGLSLEGRVRGLPVARFGSLLGGASAGGPSLTALTRGARSAVRVRLSVEALAALSGRESEALAKVGLDPKELRAALTGEIVGVESPEGVAVVLGCKDAAGAAKLVGALGALLERGVKQLEKKEKKGKDRPSFKVRKATIAGRPAYRVQIESTRPELPLKVEVAIASGPLGLLLGAPAAVEPLAKLDAPPAPPASAPVTPEEQRAFDERAVLSLRMGLGDPLAAAAPQLEAALASAGLPPQAKQGIDLARFMLDQLDGLTLGILLEPQSGGSLQFVLRLTTLHRDGVAADDKARDAWAKALQAKLGGDRAGFESALKQLAADHPSSRYGKLLERQKGGLLTVAATGVLAAVAIPAFLKYTRRAKLVEVHQNLARIASAGKFQEGKFPATTPWTPARSCCQGKSSRRCTPEPKDWEHPTWKALGFSLSDPHYFQYRFVSSAKGFTAEARGDLNCDGKTSSYRIEGTRGDDGSVSLSPMRSQDGEE